MNRDHKDLIESLKRENDVLRGLLAKGMGDCVYCGLPARDIAKCAFGFPGCSRMDDIIGAPETENAIKANLFKQALVQIKTVAGNNETVHAIVDGALDEFV